MRVLAPISCPPAAVGLSAGDCVPGSKHRDAAGFEGICSAVPDGSPKVGPAPIRGHHKEQQPAGGTSGLMGYQQLSSFVEAHPEEAHPDQCQGA